MILWHLKSWQVAGVWVDEELPVIGGICRDPGGNYSPQKSTEAENNGFQKKGLKLLCRPTLDLLAFTMRNFGGVRPFLKMISSPLRNAGWNYFLLSGRPIFRIYLGFIGRVYPPRIKMSLKKGPLQKGRQPSFLKGRTKSSGEFLVREWKCWGWQWCELDLEMRSHCPLSNHTQISSFGKLWGCWFGRTSGARQVQSDTS